MLEEHIYQTNERIMASLPSSFWAHSVREQPKHNLSLEILDIMLTRCIYFSFLILLVFLYILFPPDVFPQPQLSSVVSNKSILKSWFIFSMMIYLKNYGNLITKKQ